MDSAHHRSTPIIAARLIAALEDRYRIERELGQGGMATVYLALDLRHDRRVAVKVLKPELAAVIGAERFLAEIRTTANLQHPHILPLFDSGAADSFLFYVMPYVEGESLRDRISREKQLPIPDAVRIASEVAGALDYAHRHKVIHRDIKPENILLHDGRALVADFGIALAVTSAGTRMTETGMSLGTPQYMSPEQAMGARELDARSDVYALGCVTYEMLSGDPPFTGSTAQAIVARVVTERPRPLIAQRHTIPPNVEAAVLTALEKLPADRFASTAEFGAALANPHFTGSHAAADRGSRRSVERRSLALAGLVGLALGAAALRVLVPPRTVTVPEHRTRLTYSGNATLPAVSPDGRWLAYVRGVCDEYRRCDGDLVVQELPGGPATPILSGARQIDAPRWSPNGARLLVVARPAGSTEGVYLVPRAGGLPRRVQDWHRNYSFRNDTVASMVSRDEHSLVLVDLATGEATDTVKIGDGLWDLGGGNWRPHGSLILFGGGRPDGTNRIGIADASGRLLDTLRLNASGASWEPDGTHIWVDELIPNGDVRAWRQAVDRSGRFTGRPTLQKSDIPMNQIAGLDQTPNGYVITEAEVTTDVWSFHLPGSGARQLTRTTAFHVASSISPDGRFVAYIRQDGVGANIYIVPTDGGAERQVTADSGVRGLLQWLPGQDHLSSVSLPGRSGGGFPSQIDDIHAGVQRRLVLDPEYGIRAWLPDGRAIETQFGGHGLALADSSGHILRRFPLPDSSGYPFWGNTAVSPDGADLALVMLGATENRIYALHLADGVYRTLGLAPRRPPLADSSVKEQQITMNALAWAGDGFIYLSRYVSGGRAALWRIPARGGEPAPFAELPVACSPLHFLPGIGPALTLSRDGRVGACIVTEQRPDLYLIERGPAK